MLISEARKSGARKHLAAELLGLTLRTLQRWGKIGTSDKRKDSRAVPANKLSGEDRRQIIKILESREFADLNPNQIVPRLADQGIYVGSEATMYRILRQQSMNTHRQSSQPVRINSPEPLSAIGPNQLWSWDITYLPSKVRGQFYYLYMIMDLYSRKVVAYQVYDCESGELASDLVTDACLQEKIVREQVTLHSDNGSPMKSVTMLAKLQDLGVIPSFSRPSVSNDNPFSESLFKTLKYRPEYPEKPFDTIVEAREWIHKFVTWYNTVHLHSSIRFVTPADRHAGNDVIILANRHQVYQEARLKHPERWSGKTRKWEPDTEVVLKKFKRLKAEDTVYKDAA
ncbi:MAG: IS3 family transposase [Desulfocapsa sp.]|nr:IS3 family transposase [Desulfocapsa sp.]